MTYSGTLLKGGQIVLPSVTLSVRESTRRGGFKRTEGTMDYPGPTVLNPDDDYELHTPDGRSVGIRVLGTNQSSSGRRVVHIAFNGGWSSP
jgi:hypothetical protein